MTDLYIYNQVNTNGEGVLDAALKKVFSVLDPNLRIKSHSKNVGTENLEAGYENKKRIGLVALSNTDQFLEAFCALDSIGCGPILIISLSSLEEKPWDRWQILDRKAIEGRCFVASTDLKNILDKLEECKQCAPVPHVGSQTAIAELAYRVMQQYSHGGNHDITNLFLGPLRMLLAELGDQAGRCLLTGWSQEQKNSLSEGLASLSALLRSQDDNIVNLLDADNFIELTENDRPDLEGSLSKAMQLGQNGLTDIMHLLTDIRTSSGHSPSVIAPQKGFKAVPVQSEKGNAQRGYAILVVDDHAAAWRPIFQIVADKLSCEHGCNITIEFCVDGEKVSGSEIDVWSRISCVDLVLLDLYLPKGKKGLEWLERIRSGVIRTPVVLWTTSLAKENSAEASLANGFLFKKEASITGKGGINETIDRWLSIGQARRQRSLLNPFFDYAIKTSAFRDCARGFTDWALKTMDGLHGLDQGYLRFFNDHGGRHLNGDLCKLEKLLRPLLLVGGENSVFPEDPQERERHLLWLYVAAICHDTGMLPLPCEDMQMFAHSSEMSRKARKQHGVRVLALLNCPYLRDSHTHHQDLANLMDDYFPDGTESELNSMDKVAISLIASYHSQSNKPQFDLAWIQSIVENTAEQEVCTHLDSNEGPENGKGVQSNKKSCSLHFVGEGDKKASEKLEQMIKKYAANVYQRKANMPQLDKMSALLRLADGLDIDFTRLPASHILNDPCRSKYDDCENFKRQILTSSDIDMGEVSLQFRVPWQKHMNVSNVENVLQDFGGSKVEEYLIDTTCAVLRCLNDNESRTCTLDDVAPEFPANKNSKEQSDMFKAILKTFFGMPRELRNRYTGVEQVITVVATLAVVCEVNERYEGIQFAGLENFIKLGEVAFYTCQEGELTILDLPQPYESRTAQACPALQEFPKW